MIDLKNKVAIVTGGSKGIGREIVKKFSESGCNVAFTYLSSEDSAAEIENLARIFNFFFQIAWNSRFKNVLNPKNGGSEI